MTKQNTHPEHGDVDISVVEHLPVSESHAPPSSPENAEPVGEAVEASVVSPGEQATRQAPQSEEEQKPISGQANQNVQSESSGDSPAEVARPAGESVETSSRPPIVDAFVVEEEVRPFTDFIEEFRQAEERFNSSLQEYQAEVPSLLTPDVEEAQLAPPASEERQVNDVGAASSIQFNAPAESPTAEQANEGKPQIPGESPAAKTAAVPQAERPVSPLLRPASRLRLPRHGGGRHREEQPVESVARPEAETPKEAGEEPKVEPAVTEPASIEEQPRPARRYRFDRPTPSTVNAPAAPSLTTNPASASQAQSHFEEHKDITNRSATPVPTRPENGRAPNGQASEKEVQTFSQAKQVASGVQATEQSLPKQPFVQEASVEESNISTLPVAAPVQEHDRRRRSDRQRSKEQSTPALTVSATPVAEATPTTAEPVPSQKKEEVSPEDLPPLEYSELQKANSRRRRRRHTGSSVPAATTPIAAKAATPEVPPVAAPVQMPFVPPYTPAPAPANQRSITSGYTVNQMNQSHDGANAFMGPEPSPAHGSIAAQHARSIRTDVQRTPAYPVRTTEATSASVHQLASIVSQAIQTQTDRMVAELRRTSQAPTNISVSMPPFPSTERVGVFVDVANLLYSARTLRMTVDFGKLLDFLRGNRRLVRAHAYCPTSPQPGDEQMFLQAVKGLGYRITTKNYKTFSSGAKKADLDLDLCMDVVRLVDGRAVDCVVLVSGDSDFMPMLDYCSDHGVRVEVAAFDEAMSATLRQSCDLFINLSMLEEIRV